jgi:DNA polymerase III epsilon subunit-like protein
MNVEKPTRVGAHSQAVHHNGNILCAIDTETTGLKPGYHEIWQVAVVPLKSDLTVNTSILPFYTEIVPNHPERIEPDARKVCKLDDARLERLIREGIDCWRAADLLDEWFQRLNLGFRKQIIPLAHNWPHDAAFLLDWLGHASFNAFFFGHRDTLAVANMLNDIADMNNEPWPFPKVGLKYLCSQMKVENTNPHDALGDAVATAECYRRLVTRYKIYG